MSKQEMVVVKKSLAKGMIAGLIGGVIATAAKTFAERLFPAHADGVAGQLVPADKTASSQAIHWGFGAAVGAAYGGLAEFYPAATAKGGASFGLALGTLTQEGALQGIGIPAEPEGDTLRGRTSEMTSHVVYGVVAESVRSVVRRIL
jgi:putative membrane protein